MKNIPRPDVVAIVLGGGRGTRLYPLTHYRSKPAVPLAGKYRLVDVPISNCIHSGIRKIFVLTQFNSASLNRHISSTYKFDDFSSGYVEILAAEQTPETEAWFQGTADAVRRSLTHVLDKPTRHVLILSGDALYRQDYAGVLEQHERDGAEITVCCKLVDETQASGFGIVGIDSARRVTSFTEKPRGDALPPLKVQSSILREAGLAESATRPYLGSMGIYVFNTETLRQVLRETDAQDFGKEVIPRAMSTHRVFAGLFDGYWEDIGTIGAFFRANLDLLLDKPEFSFFDDERPIFTHSRILPSSEILDSRIGRAMIAEGCMIRRATIDTSVIGIRSIIREGAELENVVMMGADFYEESLNSGASAQGGPCIGVGRDVVVRNAIIDKNARIGDGSKITNESGTANFDSEHYSIRDGIIIIQKNAILPPGTVI